MLIKLEKIINCTSEHPSYPASNLLQQRMNASWRCAKPGELMASVIFQMAQSSRITGMDIGNYRSCVVVVEASTSSEPDNWLPVVNHRFMTHDEAANGLFKDQVQLFTKRELNSDTMKIKFDRVKVSCMQSSNLRELFGLAFLILRTEVVLELTGDVLGRFKLKTDESTAESFKERCIKMFPNKKPTYKENLVDKIKETGASNFAKRQEEAREPTKRPLLEKMKVNAKVANENKESAKAGESSASVDDKKNDDPSSSAKASSPVRRTPFGDVIAKDGSGSKANNSKTDRTSIMMKKKALYYDDSSDDEKMSTDNTGKCSVCDIRNGDRICPNCNKLPPPQKSDDEPPAKKPKVVKKPKKQFSRLFEDVKFSLSGYVNPQRDEIRRKALKMGGKYVVDPNTSDKKCTHLVCAFQSTPKSQQLKGHTKIVSHKFIEKCYDKKKRLPWRRFALDASEKSKPESEEEIEGTTSPVRSPNPYEQDTDSDSNY